MKRINVLLIALLVFCFASISGLAEETYNFSIGTSVVGGSMYTYGVPFAKIITDKVPNAVATPESTPAGNNIQLMEKGDLQLAYASAASIYNTWNGLAYANGIKYRRARAIFATYPSLFHHLVLDKSPIRNIRDLEGKRVHMSVLGTASNLNATDTLEALNITPKEKALLVPGTAAELLRNGRIDTWASALNVPAGMVLDLQTQAKVRFIETSLEDLEKIVAKHPYCTIGIIPGGTYNFEPNDFNTLVNWNFALADKDLPDEIVYNIVKAVFENLDEFISTGPAGKDFAPENILHSIIPIHPGAIKYYEEIGIKIPENLIP